MRDNLARCALSRARFLVRTVVRGVLPVVLCASLGGCQERRAPLSEAARVAYDSLEAAEIATFELPNPNLGYDRGGCVYYRTRVSLGRDLAFELMSDAGRAVRARYSAADRKRVMYKLAGDHLTADPDVCIRVDSIWYADYLGKPSAPRTP